MSKGLKTVYIVFAVILAAAIAGMVMIFTAPASQTVEIISNGEVLYSFDLSHTKDRTLHIEYGGSYNIIEITDGKIHVSEAGCPDKTCVNMGFLKGGAPVVCLPNRLVIRYVQDVELDAVAG